MAGHSHWAGIKHKKALNDAKRGKLWSKLSKALMVAARMGGGDPSANPRLRAAIADARAASMPKENIQRAIKKGTGELKGGQVDEILYEGYGPGGVAILCDILTDNRNRTASEIRKLFDLHGGKLAASGAVAWMFQRKGLILVTTDAADEETLMEVAADAGADDVRREGPHFEITCPPQAFGDVCDALEAAGIQAVSKQVTRIASNMVELDADTTRQALRLLEALSDHDDVQNVSANLTIADELVAELEKGT